MHIGPGEFARYFFWRFPAFLTKSKMAANILCHSLSKLELLHGFFMFGSKGEPYPGRVLISFWCDYDNKNFFLRFRFLGDISVLLIFSIINIW